MLSTPKINLILAALSTLLLAVLTWLHQSKLAQERALAANRQQCEQRIERLRSDFEAETEDLRQYLQTQYNFSAASPRTASRAESSSLPPPAGDWDPEEVQSVDRKYRYMYESLDRDSVREMLRLLLLEREQMIAAGNVGGQQIAAVEAQIGELLGAGGYQEYQLLKNSDSEQHHLREYAASLSGSAPINQEQERSLLFTKLRHKLAFHRALHDAGFYRHELPAEALEYTRNSVRKSLEEYRNSYLSDVKPLLSSEQFNKLKSYETTEFNWELERLYKEIDARAASPR
jgi:hypothetical protein